MWNLKKLMNKQNKTEIDTEKKLVVTRGEWDGGKVEIGEGN